MATPLRRAHLLLQQLTGVEWRSPLRGLATSASMADPEAYRLPSKGSQLGQAGEAGIKLSDSDWKSRLSSNQYLVLRKKATEPGHRLLFPDGFDNHFEEGVYFCAGCLAAGTKQALYTNKMKFDCGCGWPGFWTNVDGNVIELQDADGSRWEILCSRCHGHLGHVFRGEGFGFCTDERHCVNSMSLAFMRRGSEEIVMPSYQGPVFGF
ncbi:Peptide methionine sulfoxide reductase B5 (AtMSRB5) (Peptide-methionine (R)-S-oxide reductase) [Durusdinium trenchii]|uniref:Peptide methionine sulfoxide reductase B5 (AtMSRB5) (Peptide-methionine (R)-S-oxide reductase) n=1 Tax=Durusdinium trenchii TaxID=1381693 RepID=A0ABP0IZH7_9DINO